jgi:hypothetical protein
MSDATGTKPELVKSGDVSQMGKIVVVKITYDPSQTLPSEIIKVDVDPFWVSKGKFHQVQWVSQFKGGLQPPPPFTIEFDSQTGTPFYERQFSDVLSFSGLVRREVQPDESKIYKYTIRIDNTELDPGGGVRG